jgi:hypothetical protein
LSLAKKEKYARVFVPGKPFELSAIFASKAIKNQFSLVMIRLSIPIIA